MAVDLSQLSNIETEPGELPPTMTAWVIRQEREGEPIDAFQLEEIEVPEPAAFEVVVRVMAAGVNFNNVWASLGKPVSVFRYHPNEDHHIGGSDASGVVWKVGPGVTRWKAGDEVVVHCNQASYEDVEVHGLDPLAAPSQQIWGYETSWGSFAQFCKVQAQQLLPKPEHLAWEEAASYGLTYFTAYRMLMDQCDLQAGHKVLIWGAAGGLGVFATQLCALTGADCVGVVSSDEKGALVEQLGAKGFINRSEFAGMMRRGGETPEEEKARFKVSRDFAKRVKEILGDAPDIVFEHVGKATFPTSVFTVKPFGKVVICGATSGFDLDFDVRYLWMRQKQIIGSHFANAWQCHKANAAHPRVEDPSRPVEDDGLRGRRERASAHAREQARREDRDPRGRDRRRPGQDGRRSRRDHGGGRCLMAYGVVHLPFYATGFRGDDLEAALAQLAPISVNYGALRYDVYRSRDDRYKFLMAIEFERKDAVGRVLLRRGVHGHAGRLLELVHGAAAVHVERLRLARRAAPRRGARRRRGLIDADPHRGLPVRRRVRELIAAIDAAHQAQAEIWGEGGFGVHPDSRRGAIAQLPSDTEVLVQDTPVGGHAALEAALRVRGLARQRRDRADLRPRRPLRGALRRRRRRRRAARRCGAGASRSSSPSTTARATSPAASSSSTPAMMPASPPAPPRARA